MHFIGVLIEERIGPIIHITVIFSFRLLRWRQNQDKKMLLEWAVNQRAVACSVIVARFRFNCLHAAIRLSQVVAVIDL